MSTRAPSTFTPVNAHDWATKGYVDGIGGASAATTSTAGIVQLATSAEVIAGTDTAKATTAAGVKAAIDARGYYTAAAATTSAAGLVQLATGTEAVTGTDTAKAITAAALKSATDARQKVYIGTTNGLVGSGLWIQTDGSGNVQTFWVDDGGH